MGKINKLLWLIVALAAILRLVALKVSPPALNWDEVSHGYNAYALITTGKDEWGSKWPFIFRAYGDYKLPVYIYLTAVSEKIFGLNEFAVRLPSALAGIGTVIFTFYLSLWLLGGRKKWALWVALLMAVEPWSLFLSRGAFEANLALFLITAGFYFFLSGLKDSRKLLLSLVLLGLSVWTYNSARVFVPLLLLALVLIFREELKGKVKKFRKFFLAGLLLFLFFFAPMFWQLSTSSGLSRYAKVAILDEGAIARIINRRQTTKLPPLLSRLVFNKAAYFLGSFGKNYVEHFSPDFLFFSGGTNYQFSVPGRGLLSWVNLPFFLLGLWFLLKNNREKSTRVILAWLLLSPVASSLTREAPHVLRSIVMLPMPMVITAMGLGSFLKRKSLTGAYLLCLFLSLAVYLKHYYSDYRTGYSWSWQYGYKEAVGYVKDHYEDYQKIMMTKKYGEPHEFLLFYWPWSALEYNRDLNLVRFNQSNWWWVDRFDKFYFVNDWQVKDLVTESKIKIDCGKIKCLLVTSPGNFPKGWQKLKTINFLDGKPAFEIYEN